MTPAEATWENEGGACHPERGPDWSKFVARQIGPNSWRIEVPEPVYSPAPRALTDCELAIMRQLACEFFGSVQALEDGNLEGLEMAESSTFDYGEVA